MLTEAFQGVSQEGIVTVRDAKSQTSFVKILGDVEIDQGYLSPAMITDPRSCESVVEEPLVLLTDQLIASAEQIVPALTITQKAGRPLFVMAQDVTGEALATIALNNCRKKVFALAVKATAYGERRKEILQDIAVLTRSQVISSDLAMSLENITPQQLGTAQWIRSVPGHTYIGGSGDPEAVRRRVIQLRWEIQTALYEVDRVNLRNRLARLTGGVAIIYAGAPTEAEMRAKRQRLKSQGCAVQSSLRQGVVPGGGIALRDAGRALTCRSQEPAARSAFLAFQNALQEPFRVLCRNAGLSPHRLSANLEGQGPGFGYDFLRREYGDMLEMGLCDSLEVVSTTLSSAVSLAGSILSAGAAGQAE